MHHIVSKLTLGQGMNRQLPLLSLAVLLGCNTQTVKADELPFTLSGHVRVNYGHQDWQLPEIRDGLEFESIKLGVAGESDQFS